MVGGALTVSWVAPHNPGQVPPPKVQPSANAQRAFCLFSLVIRKRTELSALLKFVPQGASGVSEWLTAGSLPLCRPDPSPQSPTTKENRLWTFHRLVKGDPCHVVPKAKEQCFGPLPRWLLPALVEPWHYCCVAVGLSMPLYAKLSPSACSSSAIGQTKQSHQSKSDSGVQIAGIKGWVKEKQSRKSISQSTTTVEIRRNESIEREKKKHIPPWR